MAKKKINAISLFDGISGAMQALKKNNTPVNNYFASEIEKTAIEISKRNHKGIIHVWSVTELSVKSLDSWLDLLIGGSPCQDLSIANKNRLGLKGNKSKLFYEYVRILGEAREINPDIEFLLENVATMKDEDKNIITGILWVEPVYIDSADILGQRRKRYYWTNIVFNKDNIPLEDQTFIKDILLDDTTGHNVEYYEDKFRRISFLHNGTAIVPEATKKGFTEIPVGCCVDLSYINSKTRRGRKMEFKSNALTTSHEFYKNEGGGD